MKKGKALQRPVSRGHRVHLWAAALAVVVLVVYWPVRTHEFVNYDDEEYITQSEVVRHGLTRDGLREAFLDHHNYMWHPLTSVSHMLDVEIFDLEPGPHQLENAALHALNAVLLLLLLFRMTGREGPSLAVAVLFALHPLRVESVAWAAERKDVLCGLFWMLGLLAYVRWCERPDRGRWWTLVGVYALGIMTKPLIITFPFLLLLLDVWPLNRLPLDSLYPDRNSGRDWFQGVRGFGRDLVPRLREKAPLFLLAGLLGVLTWRAQTSGDVVLDRDQFPLAGRLGNVFVAYAGYLGKLVWPAELPVFYPHPGAWPLPRVLGSLLLVAALTGTVIWLGRRRPYLPVGWFWFLGLLVPVIGLVQSGGQSMANRYTYLSTVGVLIAVVWTAADGLKRYRNGTRIGILLVAVLGLAGAARTRGELGYWRDSVSLFARTLDITGDAQIAAGNLGAALLERGRTEEAYEVLAEALQRLPEDTKLLNNAALAASRLGRFPEALARYQELLGLEPKDVGALNNLGNLLVRLGRAGEGLRVLEAARGVAPEDPETLNNLGLAYADLGKVESALASYRQALALRPDFSRARQNLGLALADLGKPAEALEQYRLALEYDPGLYQAKAAAALACLSLDRPADAVVLLRDALHDAPEWTFPMMQLARVLATHSNPAVRNPAEALHWAGRAVELTGSDSAEALDALSLALAANGRSAEAVNVAQRAVQLARRDGNIPLAESILQRLEKGP